MIYGSTRKRLHRVAFAFTGEFISVPGNDEEILDIFAYGFTIVSPERCNGIEKKCQCIHTEFPDLLIVILVFFH